MEDRRPLSEQDLSDVFEHLEKSEEHLEKADSSTRSAAEKIKKARKELENNPRPRRA
jgi:prefoldin subunit 5